MHFIRAFPIVIALVLVFGCCFVFADSEWVQGSQPVLIVGRTLMYSGDNNSYYVEPISSLPIFAYGVLVDGTNSIQTVLISQYPADYNLYTNDTMTGTFSLNSTLYIDGVKYYVSFGNYRTYSRYLLPYMTSSSVTDSVNFVFTNTNIASQGILYNITKFIFKYIMEH